MTRSRWTSLAPAALMAAMTAGCSPHMPAQGMRGPVGEIANDQANAPTKIRYFFKKEVGGGDTNYALYLNNGYDRPLKIYYKVYMSAREPLFGDQYLYSGKESFALGLGDFEPVKIEIVKLVDQ